MANPQTTPEEGTFDKGNETDQLRKALRRILACKYRMQSPGWRFSFRADDKTIEEWERLVKNG